ncbi:MAG TPA: OsmC family protein [Solirubrobacteraceae bacterium]|nr:OsmC family protein [Solirubrobacteraceae bacterium]
MAHVHEYRCRLEWTGSTGAGYDAYDRTHRVSCPPAGTELPLSSDPAFGGNPDLLNPEQLLVAAASSCQMLSFLAYAARARIDVVSYADEAEAVMPEDDKPVRITEIVLRPRIVLAGDADEARVRHFVERAHEACFIANSLRSDITIEAQIKFAPAATAGRDSVH